MVMLEMVYDKIYNDYSVKSHFTRLSYMEAGTGLYDTYGI